MQEMLVPTLDWKNPQEKKMTTQFNILLLGIFPIQGWKNPQEKKMTTQFNILAWEIPIEKPGGLQSVGHKRVRHDLATKQQQ